MHLLHARPGYGECLEPALGRLAVGIVEVQCLAEALAPGNGSRPVHRRQGQQLVADVYLASPLEVTLAVGVEWDASAISQRGAAGRLAPRQAIDDGVGDRDGAGDRVADHPHLRAAHSERKGLRGIGAVQVRAGHRVWLAAGNGRHGLEPEHDVVQPAEDAARGRVPVIDIRDLCTRPRWSARECAMVMIGRVIENRSASALIETPIAHQPLLACRQAPGSCPPGFGPVSEPHSRLAVHRSYQRNSSRQHVVALTQAEHPADQRPPAGFQSTGR